MASLEDLRGEIDAIDRAMVDLLARRLQVCTEVAEIKAETGATVIQPARVRSVLATRAPNVVISAVCGMTATSNVSSVRLNTVSEQPS
ncbi:MAG: Chorismate mutase type, partial [Actinomycetota bacterium]